LRGRLRLRGASHTWYGIPARQMVDAMKSMTVAMVLCISTAVAHAEEAAINQDAPAAEKANEVVETVPASTEKKVDVKPEQEIRLPPGFAKVKRGKHVLYCKQDSNVGTRFKSQKCFDEAGMRDYFLAQQQNNRDFDRARSTCSSMAACGGG